MLLDKIAIVALLVQGFWSPSAAGLVASRCPVYELVFTVNAAMGNYFGNPNCKIEIKDMDSYLQAIHLDHEELHAWLDYKGITASDIAIDFRQAAVTTGNVDIQVVIDQHPRDSIHWPHWLRVQTREQVWTLPKQIKDRYYDWHVKRYRVVVPLVTR